MYTLLLFVIALSAIVRAYSDQKIQADKPTILFPKGDALQFADMFIRKVSGKHASVLGKEFRDSDGNLRKFQVNVEHEHLAGTAPVIPNACPTNPAATDSWEYGAGSFDADGGTVQWSYAVPNTYTDTFDSASISANLCLVINGNLGAVNINTVDGQSATVASIPVGDAPVSNFVSCENCYAYVGAQVSIGFVCDLSITASVDGVSATDACTIKFSTSGATEFNMDFSIQSPDFTTSEPAQASVLVPAPSTPIALMQDDASGIYITASPALNYEFYGQMTGTGSLDITAAFNTKAGFTVQASIVQTDGDASLTAFEGVELYSPAVKSNMKFTNPMALNLNIIPTITWAIGIGCGSGIPGFSSPVCASVDGDTSGVGMNMVVVTPFTAAYSWTQDDGTSGPVATSGLVLSVQADLTQVNAYVELDFTSSKSCPGTPGDSLSTSDLFNGCAYLDILPTTISTDDEVVFTGKAASQSLEVDSDAGGPSSGGGSGSGSSTSGKLSGGGIAGVVIGVIIATGLIGFSIFKFVLPNLTGGKPTIGTSTSTSTSTKSDPTANPMQTDSGKKDVPHNTNL